jgi:hypothetical protein
MPRSRSKRRSARGRDAIPRYPLISSTAIVDASAYLPLGEVCDVGELPRAYLKTLLVLSPTARAQLDAIFPDAIFPDRCIIRNDSAIEDRLHN